jgi:hypothetical protein
MGPEQAAARIVSHLRVCVQDGLLQIRQRRVIQRKLPLERAIGDPLVLLESGNNLCQHLLEGHYPPCVSGGTMGRIHRCLSYQIHGVGSMPSKHVTGGSVAKHRAHTLRLSRCCSTSSRTMAAPSTMARSLR